MNDYLREIAGEEITVKDFRTWGGSVLCHQLLLDAGPASNEAEAKRMVVGLDQARRREAREHAGGLPGELRASRDPRGVPRRRAHRGSRDGTGDERRDGLRAEELRLQAFLAARSVD